MIAAGVLAVTAIPQERDLVAYSTSLAGRSRAQRHNAALAAREIDGAILPPGGEFSFNERVGTFSRDAGYRRAPVSYNGQLVDDWGGGVCQTSTTMYNAALEAGLEVRERAHHRFAPSYVPIGRDAAVAYPNIDLRLRNPYDFPIRILADVEGSRLRIRLRGTRDLPRRPEVRVDAVRLEPAGRFRLGEAGGRLRNTGRDGATARVWRIWSDGRRELISEDHYPAMARVTD